MANFKTAFDATLNAEGGYVNDPDDNGKETFSGVSRKNFPSWKGWQIIDAAKANAAFPANLSLLDDLQSEVEKFYKTEFWDQLKLDAFSNQEIAAEIYDTAVNCGTYIAAVFLQKALNVLNRNQTLYADLPITGHIGALTTEAANKSKDPKAVLKVLNCLQGARYVEICLANPKQEKFMYGWLKRVVL